MMGGQITSDILAAVERGFDEQFRQTAALVSCPSLRGQEATAQDLMTHLMAQSGLETDRFPLDPVVLRSHRGHSPIDVSYEGMTSVVGSWRPRQETGRSLIINGHVDVVPPGNAALWKTPPFQPVIQDEWMYGRGAGDMKAGLMAGLFAYRAIRDAGLVLNGRLHVQSVVEEEATGNGTLACLLRGYRADCMFVPEPFGPSLMRAEIGPIWFRIALDNAPEHASGFQSRVANVNEAAFALWQDIKKLEPVWNARARQDPLYADHPLPLRFNLGRINGGEWPSSGPARCVIEARCAVMPGWDRDTAAEEIRAAVSSGVAELPELEGITATVDFHGFYAEGYVLEDGVQQEAALANAHRRIHGTKLAEHVSPAATDARFYGLYADTPSLVYGPICERAHGHDERVCLASVRELTRVMALFIAEWCGVSPARA